ncbi:hypothetical protein RY831_03890 [Noviherbaspirillum sp. CPCC 100848]|uniref:Uncharacterized protein n=1 Tax=Noviherbaspirillum album TaxID=3080276 RepID=A0ABU6J3R0_9BURK|nr:hypothetical protein [Noviherbaspirillum sp. CPCC 100848]
MPDLIEQRASDPELSACLCLQQRLSAHRIVEAHMVTSFGGDELK